ncbi:DUF4105 domain-containing protein [soil metagenome]
MRRVIRACLCTAAAVTCAVTARQAPAAAQTPVAAQTPAAAAQAPGSEITVYHATYGPGDQVWEKFGHNAIWIRDASTGSTISYNYGFFAFDQPGFVPRLMKGDMLYWMDARSADDELAIYSYYDREILLQQLNLTPAQRHALREFLEWNWLPENRHYLYDYFRDNCSTRVRDAFDRVLGGAISEALIGVPTGTTYRSHSLRLTGENLPTYAGLLLGLGSPTDRPIDAWQEGFIPMELARHLRSVQVTSADGRTEPLVERETVLYEARRAPPLEAAPDRTVPFLLTGLLIGAGLVALGHAGRRGRRSTFGLALLLSLWGVFTGFFGLILMLLWTATSHVDSYANLNLLHVNPLGFLLAVAAPLALLQRTTGRAWRTARFAWPAAVTLALLSAVGLLLQLMPGVYQVNGPVAALALPVHIAVVLALYRNIRREPSSEEDTGAAIELSAAA